MTLKKGDVVLRITWDDEVHCNPMDWDWKELTDSDDTELIAFDCIDDA